MKRYSMLCLLFAGSLFFGGCAGWLDVVPEEDIETIKTNFEKREDAEDWLKTCYAFMDQNVATAIWHNSNNPAYLGADEFCGRDFARKDIPFLYIGDGLQMAQNPYGNVWHKNQYWAAVRYCNIFLDNIDNVYTMEDDEKKLWAAEVKAVKAFYYFDLLRRYGPIVLVDKNIDPNVTFEEMQLFRRPVDECVAAIVELCDQAIPVLPYQSEKTNDHQLFFNKEAAATLKALTLLYAASPLFNGNAQLQDYTNKKGEKLFPAYNREKWKIAAEACDEAITICEAAGKKLVSGSGDRSTTLLNTMRDIEKTWIGDYANTEAILTVNYTSDLLINRLVPGPSGVSNYFDNSCQGCLSAPMNMVEMFYTDHGLPLGEDRQWMSSKYGMTEEVDAKYENVLPLNTQVLSLHCHREPRFYAMIAGDRMIWYRQHPTGGGANILTAVNIQTRQGEVLGMSTPRFDENTAQNVTGYWIKKYQSSDFTYNQYMYQTDGLPKVKYVFRLAELYLAAAEAWNEYLGAPDDRVYDPLDKVRQRAGILKVRDAWRNYARTPGKVETQAGMRDIIRQEWNIEFMFEGRRYYNLRRWMTAPQELNLPQYGWNVTSSTAEGFYNNFEGPVVAWPKRKFESPRDYFTPIRAEEILISGIAQSPGW